MELLNAVSLLHTDLFCDAATTQYDRITRCRANYSSIPTCSRLLCAPNGMFSVEASLGATHCVLIAKLDSYDTALQEDTVGRMFSNEYLHVEMYQDKRSPPVAICTNDAHSAACCSPKPSGSYSCTCCQRLGSMKPRTLDRTHCLIQYRSASPSFGVSQRRWPIPNPRRGTPSVALWWWASPTLSSSYASFPSRK